VSPACAPASPRQARCFALLRVPVPATQAAAAGVRPFTAGAGARSGASVGPAGGLTPAALAHAYGYEPDSGAAAGQTVAVVDAFDDPRIEADLAAFDSHYGLGECTKADGCFRKLNQEGAEKPLPAADKSGWSWEISLDVEAVRATCNRCHILLVEAANPEYKNLADAARAAVLHGATELSNSYGGPEGDLESAEMSAYNAPGVVVTAATGDLGWDDWNYLLEGVEPPAAPNAPASLPTVVSVGGTSLQLGPGGERSRETVWNDDGPFDEGELAAGYVTGGGCSTRFFGPTWQQASVGYAAAGCGGRRLSADVAADGDPLTGFDVYDDFNFCGTGLECKEVIEAISRYGGWETFGGTSLASPIIASMYALAGGSGGLRYPALTLYAHLGNTSALYDVTLGGNGFCDGLPGLACGRPNREQGATVDCEGTTACDAAPGLDGPSGVGAPVGLSAFEPSFPTARITLPSEIVAGVPATLSAAASTDPNPGAAFSSWSWTFGDGTPASTVAGPVHTFAAPGSYTVTLSTSDDYGLAAVPVSAVAKVITPSEAEAKAKLEEEEAARAKVLEEARIKLEEEEQARMRAGESGAGAGTGSGTGSGSGGSQSGAAPGGAAAALGVSAFKGSAPAPLAPLAQLAAGALRVSPAGRVVLHLSCPAGASTCTGTVTLRLLTPAGPARSRRGHLKAPATSSVAFSIAVGQVGAVVIRLDGAALALLGRSHTARALATVESGAAPGAHHTTTSAVTLRLLVHRRRSG
jgi:PKD repeat protein